MREAIKSLIVELDYQKEFTYEQRVDFFNKWSISTSTKFFNPIMSLFSLIEKLIIDRSDLREYDLQNYGVSHSGAVMTAFNKKIKSNSLELIKIKIDNENLLVIDFFRYNYGESGETKKYTRKGLFRVDRDGIFTFKLINADIWFKENMSNPFPTINDFINDFKRTN